MCAVDHATDGPTAGPGGDAGILRVDVLDTHELGADVLAELRIMLEQAFDGRLDDHDWAHTMGGTHAVARLGADVVGHAAVVPRRMRIARQAVHVGYVEGVAVTAAHRRRRIGQRVMAPLHDIIRHEYDLGCLSAGDDVAHFYRALGWWQWKGATWVDTPQGTLRTADEDGGIYAHPGRLKLDLNALRFEDLTCDWRPGDVW